MSVNPRARNEGRQVDQLQVAERPPIGSVTTQAATPRRYRPELQGLRALAAVLVVLYHVWFGRISGGVDVFFVISGFLITGQLVRACGRGRIEFRPMWARLIKRLFPAALTVLLAVMVASWLLLPETRWFQTIREVFASALYLENWQLVANAVDYFAQHNSASVVQHFWSLSIQGQFYVVWPVLIAVVAVIARHVGWDLRGSVGVALGVLFAASMGLSVWLTAVDQPLAYFHSATRVWEFALGGLLALVIDRVVLPAGVRVVLGWAGVAGLVLCGLVLQVGTVFPGYAALWPTMSAVLVLLAGTTGSGLGADRVLSSRPLEYVGNLSYALYLWHWPVLLFYLVTRDRTEVGLLGGGFVIGVSMGLSVLTYHFIETPVRESKSALLSRWAGYRFGVAALVPVLLVAGTWQAVATNRAGSSVTTLEDPDHPGAQAMLPGFEYRGDENAESVPSFVALTDDWPAMTKGSCSPSPRNDDLQICTYSPSQAPQRWIALVGDSHADQYTSSLLELADRRDWGIIRMVKGACPFSVDADAMPGDQGCIRWNADVADELIERRPDAVLTLATRDVRAGLTEYTPSGFVEQWRVLEQAGIPVLAFRDNARHDFSLPDCAAAKGGDSPDCATPRAELFAPQPPYEAIADVPLNVSFLDFTDYFCTEQVCPAEIGNVLVHMDSHHISATYMRTLAPVVERKIDAAMGW
jgi:peptidoglycan/LPS O-acetylase OafA/YrhL